MIPPAATRPSNLRNLFKRASLSFFDQFYSSAKLTLVHLQKCANLLHESCDYFQLSFSFKVWENTFQGATYVDMRNSPPTSILQPVIIVTEST